MRIHIVGRGETLLTIAKKTGLSAARLAAENGLTPSSRTTEGQSLLYTRPARSRAVRHGEKAEDLCRVEGITTRRLLRLNPALEADGRLSPGEEVAVAAGGAPFGSLSVFGWLSARAEADDPLPSLPYLTCLVCEGCRFTEEGILAPAAVRRLRDRHPSLMPALWAAVDAETLSALLRRGCTGKLSVMLRDAGFEGLCIVCGDAGMVYGAPCSAAGAVPLASPARKYGEGTAQGTGGEAAGRSDGRTGKQVAKSGRQVEKSERPATKSGQQNAENERQATKSGQLESRLLWHDFALLYELLTDAGMGMCAVIPENGAADVGSSPVPCLLRNTECESVSTVCRRIGASDAALRRRLLWPRLPDSAVCSSLWPDGTRKEERVDLRQIPSLAARFRPVIRREEGGASFSYRTRAGRQAIRHDLYFEDAFSLSEGLYGMNRCGIGGVWCDAVRVPRWMLYMLSACYEIVDPPART